MKHDGVIKHVGADGAVEAFAEGGKRFAGVWVTGTDTGVGKTLVSSGLVRALADRGVAVAGLKPLVSGAVGWEDAGSQPPVGGWRWEDLEWLSRAGRVALPDERRSAVRLLEPASPHFAAAAEGRRLDPAVIVSAVSAEMALFDFAVVEGVGGFRVPVTTDYDTADLAAALGLPVVIVVGLRLGAINHALLTAEAIRARGLLLAGWVANAGIDSSYRRGPETVGTLDGLLGVPCSAFLPLLPEASADGPAARESLVAGAAGVLDGLALKLWKHGRVV